MLSLSGQRWGIQLLGKEKRNADLGDTDSEVDNESDGANGYPMAISTRPRALLTPLWPLAHGEWALVLDQV